MDDLLAKLGWKKMAAIIVVGSLSMLVFVAFSFRSDQPEIVSEESEQLKSETTGRTGTTNNSQEGTSQQRFVSEYFSISYPSDFQAVPLESLPGILERTKFLSNNEREIVVTVFPRATNTVDSLAIPFQEVDYKGKVIDQNGMPGLSFSGRIDSVELNEKVAIVQKGNAILRVQLTYVGSVDKMLETQFDAMFATLQ